MAAAMTTQRTAAAAGASAQPAASTGQVWVTAAVLHALAAQPLVAPGFEFTAAQLQQWLGDGLTTQQRWHATSRLCSLGMLTHQVRRDGPHQVDVYRVTTDGQAAVLAARQGQVRRSGPKGSRVGNPLKPDSFTARLWALMRLRKMLTPEEAAATLCDAGDNAVVKRAQDTARKCLRRWANVGALAESARRVGAQGLSNGHKRYVLVRDSVNPPKWTGKTPGAAE